MTSTAPPQARTSPRPGSHPAGDSRWWVDAVALLVVAVVAGWLRSEALGPSSLWLDDAWVALASRTDGLTELRYVGFAAPGFVVMLRGWFDLVGFSETTAQALPFAAGVIAPATAYLVGRRMAWHRAAALVPAIVLVFSPMAMEQATRVKQYTIESVLALGLLAVALYLLADVRSGRRWATFVAAAALATTVSAFLAPYAAAGVGAGLTLALSGRDRVAVRNGLVAGVAYGAAAGAWYLVVLAPAVTSSISSFWSEHFLVVTEGAGPALASLRDAAVGVAGGLVSVPPAVTVVALVAAVLVLALHRPEHAVLLVTPLAVAVALAVLQLAPLGGGRTDVYLYPALALLLGGAAQALVVALPRGTGWAVPLVVTAALAGLAEPVTPYPVQDVRPLVDVLEDEQSPGDAVVLYPATIWAYALYTSGDIALEPDARSSWGFAPRFADPSVHPLPPGRDDPDAYLPTVTRVTGDVERIWLLASHRRADHAELEQQLRDAGFEQRDLLQREGAWLGRWERS